MSGSARSGIGHVSKDMNNGVPISAANSSGPSIGMSSLVTDANSSLSGGQPMQPSSSLNADSYMRLPASPMSFSSNNISASSVIDGSSIVQQSPPEEQMQRRRASSVTSQSVATQAGAALPAQKKLRMDVKQEDIVQQQLIQQLLQGQTSFGLQANQNPQLQALLRQQRIAQIQQQPGQLQQLLPSYPHQMHQQPVIQSQSQQLRPQILPHGIQHVGAVRTTLESGLCSRRLMQYFYHKRHRPEDNSISYWRKLVGEYFAPRARKRWCVSSIDRRGNNPLGAPPHAGSDAWRCDICGAKSGKGYEATFEILPRLCEIRFDHGVIDEYMFLDMPHEFRLNSGVMILEYSRAVQKTVYEHLHVVHEGQLRIIFTPELKIMCWEFCARRHEEFVNRRLVAPQVNHLLQVAQKYQQAVTENGTSGVSTQDAQAVCNMFVSSARQMAKSLELHLLNEHGLSKRYVRCLQISEVVNCMKELVDLCQKNKLGPIEGLKSYSSQVGGKFQSPSTQDGKQIMSSEQATTSNKAMGVPPEMGSHTNSNASINCAIAPQAPPAGSSYQNMLRNNSFSSAENVLQQEASSSFNGPAQLQNALQQEASRSFGGTSLIQPLQFQNSASLQHQNTVRMLAQQNSLYNAGVNQQMQSQHAIQHLLQEVKNNNRIMPVQRSPCPPVLNGSITNVPAIGQTTAANGEAHMNNGPVKSAPALCNAPSSLTNAQFGRSNSFKSVSSTPAINGSALTPKMETSLHSDLADLDQLLTSTDDFGDAFFSESGDAGSFWNL